MELGRAFADLERQLRAQVALVEACGRRIAAARDPRLKVAWIDAVARLMNASAATGSAMADIRWAPADAALFLLRGGLGLPKLPQLPDIEDGTPPPRKFHKTTSGRIPVQNSSLALAGRVRVKSKGGAPKGNQNARNPVRIPPLSDSSAANWPCMSAP
jgi:hypothetical protein